MLSLINMWFMGYSKLFLGAPTHCAIGIRRKASLISRPHKQLHPYSHLTQRTDRTYKQRLRGHWGTKTYTDFALHLNLPSLGQKLE